MKIMKTKVFIITLVLFGLTFSSCKKYEEGPILSLKSKNSRLTGEWKLVSYTSEYISIDGITVSSFDGTTMVTSNNSYLYDLTLTIDKDGTLIKSVTKNGTTNVEKSYWSWLDGTSGKEQLLLDDLYTIKKLTNKELILEYFYSSEAYADSNSTPTFFDSHHQTWTYEKQ